MKLSICFGWSTFKMNLYIYYHQFTIKQNISKLSGVLRIHLTQAVLSINPVIPCPFISRVFMFCFSQHLLDVLPLLVLLAVVLLLAQREELLLLLLLQFGQPLAALLLQLAQLLVQGGQRLFGPTAPNTHTHISADECTVLFVTAKQ